MEQTLLRERVRKVVNAVGGPRNAMPLLKASTPAILHFLADLDGTRQGTIAVLEANIEAAEKTVAESKVSL